MPGRNLGNALSALYSSDVPRDLAALPLFKSSSLASNRIYLFGVTRAYAPEYKGPFKWSWDICIRFWLASINVGSAWNEIGFVRRIPLTLGFRFLGVEEGRKGLPGRMWRNSSLRERRIQMYVRKIGGIGLGKWQQSTGCFGILLKIGSLKLLVGVSTNAWSKIVTINLVS